MGHCLDAPDWTPCCLDPEGALNTLTDVDLLGVEDCLVLYLKIPVCNAGPPSHNPSVRSKGVAKGPVFQVLYLGGVGVTDAICKMW